MCLSNRQTDSKNVCRSAGHLPHRGLGRARGHQQPEGHRSSRALRAVLPGLVRHPHLPRGLPASDEGLHRQVALRSLDLMSLCQREAELGL